MNPSNNPELERLRNRLPQYRLAGSGYFVTWRTADNLHKLSAAERTVVVNALKYFHLERYVLLCYVVMDDHVHVLVWPKAEIKLSEIIHSWKSFTAHAINKQRGTTGTVWEKDSYTRVMRDEDEMLEKAQYIMNNPLKRWPGEMEYQWVEWLGYPDTTATVPSG